MARTQCGQDIRRANISLQNIGTKICSHCKFDLFSAPKIDKYAAVAK
jgi:hypothetical protein